MIDNKEQIRHFIANIFTITNFEVLNSDIKKEVKDKLLQLINIASTIISYEDLFLGNHTGLFKMDVDLKEVIDIALVINEENISNKHVDVVSKVGNVEVHADRHFFGEAVNYIVAMLVDICSEIKIEFDEEKRQLKFSYKTKRPEDLKKVKLMELLDRSHIYDSFISYQIALEILKQHKIKFDVSDKEMIISL